MQGVDVNLWAVLAAGAAGWIVGAVWYGEVILRRN